MVKLLVECAGIVLSADFVSGIVHWWEDVYGNPDWKFLGKHIVEPNLNHHRNPRDFLKGNYWQRNNTTFIATLVLIIIPIALGSFSWIYTCIILLASQANEVHRIAHQTNKENGKFIVWLQNAGILQSRKHHGWHHKAPYDCNYCILTNYLNPILNKIKFWCRTEGFIKRVFKIFPIRASMRNAKTGAPK